MRRKLFIPSLLTALIAATTLFGAVTTYETDVAHSNIGFSIPIAGGLSHVRGKFNEFTVAIVYDDKDVSKSSVNAVIKATSIDTESNVVMCTCATPILHVESSRDHFKARGLKRPGRIRRSRNFHNAWCLEGDLASFTINGVKRDEKTGKTTLGSQRGHHSTARLRYQLGRADNPNFLGDMVEIELNTLPRRSHINEVSIFRFRVSSARRNRRAYRTETRTRTRNSKLENFS